MSTFELPVVQHVVATGSPSAPRSRTWLRAARQARLLAWASLVWMCVEGFVGVLAGVQAHSLGVVTWAASSFVEALASVIVVWRFTGHRTLSATSEARAQKWVGCGYSRTSEECLLIGTFLRWRDGSGVRETRGYRDNPGFCAALAG